MGEKMSDNTVSAASYAGAAVSVIAGLTLTEWGVVVGIITALVTLGFNIVYRIKQDRREQARHDFLMEKLSDSSIADVSPYPGKWKT